MYFKKLPTSRGTTLIWHIMREIREDATRAVTTSSTFQIDAIQY